MSKRYPEYVAYETILAYWALRARILAVRNGEEDDLVLSWRISEEGDLQVEAPTTDALTRTFVEFDITGTVTDSDWGAAKCGFYVCREDFGRGEFTPTDLDSMLGDWLETWVDQSGRAVQTNPRASS